MIFRFYVLCCFFDFTVTILQFVKILMVVKGRHGISIIDRQSRRLGLSLTPDPTATTLISAREDAQKI